MSRIENAVKRVVATDASHTEYGSLVEAVQKHVEAQAELTEALSNELSAEELVALFHSLLDTFTDEMDEEMKEARDLLQQRLGYA